MSTPLPNLSIFPALWSGPQSAGNTGTLSFATLAQAGFLANPSDSTSWPHLELFNDSGIDVIITLPKTGDKFWFPSGAHAKAIAIHPDENSYDCTVIEGQVLGPFARIRGNYFRPFEIPGIVDDFSPQGLSQIRPLTLPVPGAITAFTATSLTTAGTTTDVLNLNIGGLTAVQGGNATLYTYWMNCVLNPSFALAGVWIADVEIHYIEYNAGSVVVQDIVLYVFHAVGNYTSGVETQPHPYAGGSCAPIKTTVTVAGTAVTAVIRLKLANESPAATQIFIKFSASLTYDIAVGVPPAPIGLGTSIQNTTGTTQVY